MTLKDWALKYADLGFNVIPISPKSKRPMVKWQKYMLEKVSKNQIQSHWSRYPESNIGLVCGEISNLVVVDIDPRNGGEAYAKKLTFPSTICSLTGSGGRHYYYAWDRRIKKSRPFPGIDIQSDGSYILAPPSYTTGPYSFHKNELLQLPLAKPPHWLSNLSHANPFSKPKEWQAILNGSKAGSRHQNALKIAGAYMARTRNAELTLLGVKGWNAGNKPPLPDEEIEKMVGYVVKKYNQQAPDMEVSDTSSLIKEPVPPLDWLIQGLWPSGCGFVAGDSEQGKTWLVLDMALSIAMGIPLLGEFIPKQIGNVLVVEEEQNQTEIIQRLDLLLKGHGKSKNDLKNFYTIIQQGIQLPNSTDKLIERIQTLECKAVFIDSLSAIHGTDEISNKEMRPILNSISKIHNETGASVIVIHHMSKPQPGTTKNPLFRLRGSSALLAWADTVIAFDPMETGNHMLKFKMRGAPKPNQFELIRTYDPVESTVKLSKGGI